MADYIPPTFAADATSGDLYDGATKIETEEQAVAYLGALIDWGVTHHGQTREDSEKTQRSNLGYFSRYYDDVTYERVRRLFGVTHPIFG